MNPWVNPYVRPLEENDMENGARDGDTNTRVDIKMPEENFDCESTRKNLKENP